MSDTVENVELRSESIQRRDATNDLKTWGELAQMPVMKFIALLWLVLVILFFTAVGVAGDRAAHC
eukprot:1465520-Rhodomonas_salina.1